MQHLQCTLEHVRIVVPIMNSAAFISTILYRSIRVTALSFKVTSGTIAYRTVKTIAKTYNNQVRNNVRERVT